MDIDKRLAREARLDGFNRLITEPEAGRADSREKGRGRFGSGGTSTTSLWGMFSKWMTARSGERPPGILSLSEPSDGHPMQELTPDFGWFRPLAHNNQTWVLYWPDLTV